jgi:hypothetical protein
MLQLYFSALVYFLCKFLSITARKFHASKKNSQANEEMVSPEQDLQVA